MCLFVKNISYITILRAIVDLKRRFLYCFWSLFVTLHTLIIIFFFSNNTYTTIQCYIDSESRSNVAVR